MASGRSGVPSSADGGAAASGTVSSSNWPGSFMIERARVFRAHRADWPSLGQAEETSQARGAPEANPGEVVIPGTVGGVAANGIECRLADPTDLDQVAVIQ